MLLISQLGNVLVSFAMTRISKAQSQVMATACTLEWALSGNFDRKLIWVAGSVESATFTYCVDFENV